MKQFIRHSHHKLMQEAVHVFVKKFMCIRKNGWSFFESLSKDMIDLLPNVKGFSVTNLNYMKCSYELLSAGKESLPQVGAESRPRAKLENTPQVEVGLFFVHGDT